MNTQNNGYTSNANSNTINPMANTNQVNQAISLTKPSQAKLVERDNDNSTSLPILADTTNHQFTDLALSLDKSNNLDEVLSSDLNNSNDSVAAKISENKDFEDTHNSNKKGKKSKLATIKSESARAEASEPEQVIISFPVSTKEKKQIEAVAILSGYDTVEEFIAKLVSQGMKPYLEAVSQALNKDKA